MAEKALISKEPAAKEIFAKDLSERDQNKTFYCPGILSDGTRCLAPVHLIIRKGYDGRKEAKYFEEISSQHPHIEWCPCAKKDKEKAKINRLLKYNGKGFNFENFVINNTKEERKKIIPPGPGHDPDPIEPGGGTKGFGGGREEDQYVLPRTINDLAEIFDMKGIHGKYGMYSVDDLYLCKANFKKYYENGLSGNILVKAGKTKRCTFVDNDVWQKLKNLGYRYMAINGEEGRIELLLKPNKKEIEDDIWKTIEKYANDPEKEFVILGSWRRYSKNIDHLYVCDITNKRQFKPTNE